jgi:hypothetical protein
MESFEICSGPKTLVIPALSGKQLSRGAFPHIAQWILNRPVMALRKGRVLVNDTLTFCKLNTDAEELEGCSLMREFSSPPLPD